MTTHLLVYVDTLNRKSMVIEPGAAPIGYIERRADESVEQTARIARECFGIRADQKLRFRAISPNELRKIEEQEGRAKNLNERDFASIFTKSGAKPGRWIKISDGARTESEEESKKKPAQKRLFK